MRRRGACDSRLHADCACTYSHDPSQYERTVAGVKPALERPLSNLEEMMLGAEHFPPPKQRLRVTAQDSGTYPMDGGGVATCRQIVLEGLPDVLWTCQAEVSNDLKTVRFHSLPAYCGGTNTLSHSLCIWNKLGCIDWRCTKVHMSAQKAQPSV